MAKKKVEKCKGCGRYVYINDDNLCKRCSKK